MVRPIYNKGAKAPQKEFYFEDQEENINDILNPPVEQDSSIELIDLLSGLSVTIKEIYPLPVWIKAEVSGFKKSGPHYYFDLVQRDEKGTELAKISAKLWASNASYVLNYFKKITGKDIQSGIKSEWSVKLDYHPKYGFSVVVQDVKPIWTVGDHEIKKENIRKKLKEKGIFDNQKNFMSPNLLTNIAIIAPSAAAGLGDFKSESEKWNKSKIINVDYFTATFEGDSAGLSISSTIESINKSQLESIQKTGCYHYDLLIVLRGGGSKLSLAWLDDYDICKAICSFEGPVWTAIGHEQDTGLPDEISLKNFHTPSKAAQKIWELLSQEFAEYNENYNFIMQEANLKVNRTEEKVDNILKEIKKESIFKIEKIEININNNLKDIKNKSLQKVKDAESNINHMIKIIVGLGPSETLKRGYAIIVDSNKKVIKSSEGIKNDFTIKWENSSLDISYKDIKGK